MMQVDGNGLALLQNGTEYFPRLLADIDACQSFIYLETYIFAADETGRMVCSALERAADRGVVVRVLMDGFGSADFPVGCFSEMEAAGVHVQWFRRELYRFKMRRHRLRRLHRKLVVLDGEIAYIGGINIIDDSNRNGDSAVPRFDFAVRIEGSVAGDVHVVMRRLWAAVSWARGKRMERFMRGNGRLPSLPNLKVLLRDNLRHRRDIERAYLKMIGAAKREVLIANAYFLPGLGFRRALMQAAERGVRVVLLLQGKVEYRLLHHATQALYGSLLESGIEIYEYQPSFLHAKVAVIDGMWATVGSSNIDPFSLLLAREANLVVSDSGFSAELRERLYAAISRDALRIDPVSWRRISRGRHIVSRLSYAAVRMIIGVLGYGKNAD